MTDTFGERLRAARLKANLSQSELARRVGITPQAVQYIEAGKSARSKHAVELASALGVSTHWLINGDTEVDVPPKPVRSHNPKRIAGSLEKEGAFPSLRVKSSPSELTVVTGMALTAAPAEEYDYFNIAQQVFEGFDVFAGEAVEHQQKVRPIRNRSLEEISISLEIISNALNFPTSFEVKIPDAGGLDWFLPKNRYAIWTRYMVTNRPRIGNAELLVADVDATYDFGDYAIAWHKTNTFLLGEIQSKSSTDTVIQLVGHKDRPTVNLRNDQFISIHRIVAVRSDVPAPISVQIFEASNDVVDMAIRSAAPHSKQSKDAPL